jgi:hypothetical protein
MRGLSVICAGCGRVTSVDSATGMCPNCTAARERLAAHRALEAAGPARQYSFDDDAFAARIAKAGPQLTPGEVLARRKTPPRTDGRGLNRR